MADVGLVSRIVQCIRQVTAQHDVLAEVLLLTDSEGPPENTHVGVHSHQHNVVAAFLLKEVVDFLAVITDAVVTNDLDDGVLMAIMRRVLPRDRVVTACDLRFTSANVIDDRPWAFVFAVVVAPGLNRHGRFG